MSGIIKLEIRESAAELRELLNSRDCREVTTRIQVLYWLKTRQVESIGALAALVGRHRTTVSRWLSRYRTGGINSLLVKGKSTGRKSAIATELKAKILRELEEEEGFCSYREVQRWLKAVENVEMSYSGIHKLIRYRLQAKLKVPRPVHVKQKQGAVEERKLPHTNVLFCC
jgi:putative transposase